jgi:hypothetical protein
VGVEGLTPAKQSEARFRFWMRCIVRHRKTRVSE